MPPAKHPVRILVATDAAREGLNLQAHCWNLFHFDIPWNPSRMEQRNGRIDRKLQPKDEVFLSLLRLQTATGRPNFTGRDSQDSNHQRRTWQLVSSDRQQTYQNIEARYSAEETFLKWNRTLRTLILTLK